MGLPMSGASLAKRIDLYSWRDGRVFHTALDLEANHLSIPSAKQVKIFPFAIESRSGTAVLLSRCDRVPDFQSPSTLGNLAAELRRIFRYFLPVVQMKVNSIPLTGYDPLCITTEINGVSARQYGPTLRYDVRTDAGTYPVNVRFSLLPIEEWRTLSNVEKQQLGISKGAGISIVRARREIAYGWFFMGGKRRENYDDWWRCEVQFQPALDDLFRVSHTKQQISPCAELEAALSRDIEAIGRTLNGAIRRQFAELGKTKQSAAERSAVEQDKYLQPLVAQDGQSLRRANYKFTFDEKVSDNSFYVCNLQKGVVLVSLNTSHPFADRYRIEAEDGSRYGIEALLLAAARVELSAENERARWWFRRFRRQWSDVLAAFLGSKA
jgi:hypothetical protein